MMMIGKARTNHRAEIEDLFFILSQMAEEIRAHFEQVLGRPSKKQLTGNDVEGYFELDKQFSRLLGGATYKVNCLEGFSREIWICPVTLCVLGHYPKFIYIKQVFTNH